MAEELLFHHALGQTSGFLAFADELRRAGHTVHTPDLYDGRTFQTLNDGIAYAEEIGFGNVIERGVRVADDLPDELVYAGFSLGVLPAQKLAQTRPGARGALLFYSCVPLSEFGGSWPAGVPVQIHGMDRDPFFVDEGDIDAARELVEKTDQAELFLYPGDQHYFADSSLPSGRKPPAARLRSEDGRELPDLTRSGGGQGPNVLHRAESERRPPAAVGRPPMVPGGGVQSVRRPGRRPRARRPGRSHLVAGRARSGERDPLRALAWMARS